MDLSLTREQRAVRDAFAALFVKQATPERVRRAEATGFDGLLWRHYAEIGALGIGVPSDCGGGGGGLLELALVAEEAGRRLAPIPVAETAAAARALGRLREKELLGPVLSGSVIVSLATQPGPVTQQCLVDGAIADAVLAHDGDSLVYISRPEGLSKTGHRNLGGLSLSRWDDPGATTILAQGSEARAIFDTAIDEVRVLRASALVGLASEAVGIGSRYAIVREAFGQPIGMYQAVAHPFADAVAGLDGAQLLVRKACWAMDSAKEDAGALAAMAFVFAAETAYHATTHSLHVHGGYGFMEEYDIQLYYRRAKAWAAAFADPRRELLTVADRRFGPVTTGGW
ncbi:acyl-CoA dehydrogenase family protein [Mycobacterium intracellulare]|uniref:Acyl-CoA dehydrogenase n=2 Tax=Mycobacterium intracellulare TaxID=1767 RepID=A0A7R7MS95_MYCIT|nr:acyl-CoA dehydrogenase family protein [Mycobacterium intracellulare]AFC42550.1 acyl-CoA dehydrogenase domain-containing protein [Mycobacterium intracellulare ATCC 13950]ETZ37820.1 acyl-CoA dehydrogenase, C-terminal domain protein [Mycobacterium intracellulare MIN_061107_1834]MCA2249399.1 acyl-CoA/acyl-ACP dehydrogenase [Mycobacterium intracellulare]MCA2275890.1 acyl-CoA/acyl-ACP dehydrogenase [Mycobacterium intracellulare]MCA2327387.1 acyl-CoA/acyl-ACP dehydrogenase [Mycobacterium intracell